MGNYRYNAGRNVFINAVTSPLETSLQLPVFKISDDEVVTVSKFAAKAISTLFAVVLGFLATSTMANTDNDAIIERIKKVGSVCVEGDECASAPAPSASAGARSGSDVYNASCTACHSTGVLGAPKFGTSEWTDRGAKGMETLMQSALNGFNAMPPRGTCAACSDDEIQAAVQYMLDSAK